MIAPLRLGPLVLDLSHITTHGNENKLIPIDLKKKIYILVLLSDYIIWLQYSQNYFALEATWLFMATNSEHMA